MADLSVRVRRVCLEYVAPIHVTVNLATGDVERVYMDDESVSLADEHYDMDSTPERMITARTNPVEVGRALKIAETVDWTSTQGRCAVWRGAVGGPRNAADVILAALDYLLAGGESAATALAAAGADSGDVRATRLLVADAEAWRKEHPYDS